MLKLFGKRKQAESDVDTSVSHAGETDSDYSILFKPNGKVKLVSVQLKESLLSSNVYDVNNVLPEDLKYICQSVLRSNQSQSETLTFNDRQWIWEFVERDGNKIIAYLVNYHEFANKLSNNSSQDNKKFSDELFAQSPTSQCVTSIDDFKILQSNHAFEKMFSVNEGKQKNIGEIVNNGNVLKELQSSLLEKDQIDGLLFVIKTAGDSYWENNGRYITASIRKSQQQDNTQLIWSFIDITDYRNLKQQHETFKRKFNTSIQAATEGIWEWSNLKENGDWWSSPMYSLLALDPKSTSPSLELIKRLMHPKEKKKFERLINNEIHVHQNVSMECRLKVKDKGFRWFRIRAVAAFNNKGDLKKLIGSLVDVHTEKSSRVQLQQEKDKAVATLNSIVDAVITTNANGVVEYGNSAAERLTGIPKNELRGKPIYKMVSFYKEHTDSYIDNPVMTCLSTGKQMKQKIYADMLDRDGTRYTVQLMATPLVGENHKVFGAVLVLNDVTNIRILSRRLKYQASHDILTKLINRGEFERRVSNAIEVAQNDGGDSVVLYIDLDRFKLINDICGHAAGDELLKQIAKLIRSITGDKVSVARMGGDEFAVLIEDTYYKAAEKMAKKLLDQIAAYRFSWDGKSFTIEVSIGIAEILPSCEGLTYLLNAADSACYLAKESGRNCIRKYSEGDDTIVEKKGQE
ncbi:MAG: diguanylate cyclase, partial [Pseudomonadota bacterium]